MQRPGVGDAQAGHPAAAFTERSLLSLGVWGAARWLSAWGPLLAINLHVAPWQKGQRQAWIRIKLF